ncbi:hypothetical protein C0J52_23979 [Blattella germanica]|nr:hypothetical protein C0J52_23979 [Blattella germanica]PSN43231.1 hypothetical protein C0J52_23979 [Blattella germanica]
MSSPTRKNIRFWDNKLRTTGSLLRVKSPGKPHGPRSHQRSISTKPAKISSCCKFTVTNSTFNRNLIDNVQHLKDRIRDTLATVTQNMLQSTWNEVEYRLDICRATWVSHIEIYCGLTICTKTLSFCLCKSVNHKCV